MAGKRKPKKAKTLAQVARAARTSDTAGAGTTVDAEQPQEKVSLMQVGKQAVYRWQRQLYPLLGGLATLAVGAVLHHATHGLAYGLAGVAVAAAAWWLFTRSWLDETRERVYAALVLAGILAWLITAAVHGVTWAMVAWWAGGGFALACPWWVRHRIRNYQKQAATASETEIFDERLAQPGRALAGAKLGAVEPITHGWTGVIRLIGGEKTTDHAIAATGLIASAFDKPLTQVIVEPTLSGVMSEAQLTILNNNPLITARVWDGPSFNPATGMFDYGVYADGQVAPFQLVEPGNGAKHSLICGTTGAGKSTGVNIICAEAHLSRLVAIWLLDAQRGQSLPAWNRNVDWAALGIEPGIVMLRALRDVVYARSEYLAFKKWRDEDGHEQTGQDWYDLDPGMPLLLNVIEEAQELLTDPKHGPEAVQLLESISGLGRKVGVAVVLVTQVPELGQLGGSGKIRNMVSSGNVVCFRTSDSVSGNMAFHGAIPADPSKLPRKFPDGTDTAGLGYIVGGLARGAAQRSLLIPRGTVRRVAASLPPVPVEPLSAAAAGPAYAHRHDTPAAQPKTPERHLRSVPEPAPEATGRVADRVLILLRHAGSPVQTRDLIAEDVSSPRQLNNALNDLVTQGLVEKVKHGWWRALDKTGA